MVVHHKTPQNTKKREPNNYVFFYPKSFLNVCKPFLYSQTVFTYIWTTALYANIYTTFIESLYKNEIF